jgi:Subtilase family
VADQEQRRRYVIGARKIRKQLRDVAAGVLSKREARYRDILHSDDDPSVPEGAHVAYSAFLTPAEAALFRGASNARYVEEDFEGQPDYIDVPPPSTLAWMGASPAEQDDFTGEDVKVAVLDGGTTTALRAQCDWTLLAKQSFATGVDVGADGITSEHGCWVTPQAVPPNGQLIEAIIANDSGNASWADVAAAMVWAVNLGAKVINLSYSSPPGGTSSALQDALAYAGSNGAVVVASAGNDGLARINYPADQCRVFPYVFSSGAFDEATNARASFSNYDPDMSGVAPGKSTVSISKTGTAITWSGTSSSAPHMAQLIAMLTTGGTYTALRAAQHLRASARDLGVGQAQQGAGAWDLANAIALLDHSSQPETDSFMRIYASSTQPLPSSADTKLKFHATEEIDSDYTVNAARDLVTINRAGVYLVSAAVRITNAGGGALQGERYCGIGGALPPNNAAERRYAGHGGVHPGGAWTGNVNVPIRYAVGDQVAVWCWQNTGQPMTVEFGTANPNNRSTQLSIVRLSD